MDAFESPALQSDTAWTALDNYVEEAIVLRRKIPPLVRTVFEDHSVQVVYRMAMLPRNDEPRSDSDASMQSLATNTTTLQEQLVPSEIRVMLVLARMHMFVHFHQRGWMLRGNMEGMLGSPINLSYMLSCLAVPQWNEMHWLSRESHRSMRFLWGLNPREQIELARYAWAMRLYG